MIFIIGLLSGIISECRDRISICYPSLSSARFTIKLPLPIM
ncbi:MAG: hypothetical protein CM15mP111_0100 [Hyphomicrobiales bacterium]|nr:MAG: hypothetical protein CM15mP111_0100 [Hyphomicrobiales bacterium]